MKTQKRWKLSLVVGSLFILLMTAVSVSAEDEKPIRVDTETSEEYVPEFDETVIEDDENWVISPAPDVNQDNPISILDENPEAKQNDASLLNTGLPILGVVAVVVGSVLSLFVIKKKD